ncbi:MAG: DNA repair protein RecN [Chloroflexi bacterium]|nr:DNA repair protein RecN [Chloroflexota bacterium]
MLTRLYLRDFALVNKLVVRPGPGLNVFTGDTGAGKSIIVNAVALLAGGRAESHLVRSGSKSAFIEGVFELPAAHPVWPGLTELGIDDDESGQLIVQREIWPGGRSQVRLNSRSVTLRALESIGRLLVEINGQNQQLDLLRPARQLLFLDEFAGCIELRSRYRREYDRLTSLEAERERLGADAAARAREVDMLSYQIGEIEDARVEPDEERQLLAELRRSSNLAELTALIDGALGALAGSDGASNRLGSALAGLARAQTLDADSADSLEQLRVAQEIADQAAADLRARLESLDSDPGRAEQLAARMRQIDDLKRKYGKSAADIAEFASRAAARLEQLQAADSRIAEIESQVAAIGKRMGGLAAELRAARRRAGNRLEAAVLENLSALGMAGARFAVAVEALPETAGAFACREVGGMGPQGADGVRFDLAANPGEPLAPLAQVASGGEISRIMLALRCALLQVNAPAVIIFDEIDAGIGGRRGLAVGHQLWKLANRGQTVCVTHLPQIPAFAQRHFFVDKEERDGRSQIAVEALDRDAQMAELAAMAGGAEAAEAAAQIKSRAGELMRTFEPAG